MGTLPIHLCEDVEEKRLDIKVQRLVIEEQLRKQAKVLAVQLQYTSQPFSLHQEFHSA